MSSELLPMSEIKDKLKSKVQSAMIELLPKEAFDSFVEEAWKRFTTPHSTGTGYQKKEYPPELVTLLHEEMTEQVKARVKEWAAEWSKGDECSTAAKQILEECTNIASLGFIHNVSRGIVQQAVSAIDVVRCSCGSTAFRNQNCGNCGTWNG